jgi:hypothetical protein
MLGLELSGEGGVVFVQGEEAGEEGVVGGERRGRAGRAEDSIACAIGSKGGNGAVGATTITRIYTELDEVSRGGVNATER